MRKTRVNAKRALAMLLILTYALFMFTACTPKQTTEASLKIVCTTFPQYDWVREVVGDVEGVELALLQDKGVDLHSYQATADDIIKIKESNLFIYVGGESDDWVEDVVKDITNEDFREMNLFAVLGDKVKLEELKEGMQDHEHDHNHDHDHEHDHDHDHDHDHEHEHEHEHDHEHEMEKDEHVWLSLKNAELITYAISEQLAEIDEKNAENYRNNAKAYIEKLKELDKAYAETVQKSTNKTILFGDRFPFRYMVEDYGLDYFAAFVGCSAETEASFETVAFLANKLDELNLKSVVTIDRSNKEIARTIIGNSKNKTAQIVTLNSMQTVDKKQIEDGATYLGIMQDNLNVLKEALK